MTIVQMHGQQPSTVLLYIPCILSHPQIRRWSSKFECNVAVEDVCNQRSYNTPGRETDVAADN